MAYFPMYIDISDRKILVVGGGMTAYRKITKLAMFDAKISVVSRKFIEELRDLADVSSDIDLVEKEFEETDITGEYALIIGATDQRDVNERISREAQRLGIPVNIVDDKELCTFIFPAIYKSGDVVAGITSGGKGPLVSQYVRQTLEETLPETLGDMNDRLGELREQARSLPTYEERRKYLKLAFDQMLEAIENEN